MVDLMPETDAPALPNLTDKVPGETAVQRDVRIRRNRRLIAERFGWPNGTAEVCEDIEKRAPGWSLWWSDGTVGLAPYGYRATRDDWHVRDTMPRHVCGVTPDELVKALADVDPGQVWTWGEPVDCIRP